MKGLSERQKEMLDFIRDFIRKKGYPPTYEEIRRFLGLSTKSLVDYHLKALQEKGYISRAARTPRGIKLTDRRLSTFSVPLLGRIAAGEPIPIPESDFPPFGCETIELTSDIVRDEEGLYALQVEGDSMIDALIGDGDIVVMKHQRRVENGEMAAVWLKEGGETTLKRFYLEEGLVRLQPANPNLSPRYYHPFEVEVQGKLIAVIRNIR
jgi:repressor LexA